MSIMSPTCSPKLTENTFHHETKQLHWETPGKFWETLGELGKPLEEPLQEPFIKPSRNGLGQVKPTGGDPVAVRPKQNALATAGNIASGGSAQGLGRA